MSQYYSAEEDRKRYLDALGTDLGEVFVALSHDLTWTCIRWRQFMTLYNGDSNIDSLNEAAPFFFAMLQEMFWHDALLGITRLGGPAQSFGQENLSVRRLPALITDTELKTTLEGLLVELKAKLEFAMTWRHKLIAHRDLAVALQRTDPLPTAAVSSIEEVLNLLVQIMNAVNRHYMRSETAYRMAEPVHGVESLMYYLRLGLAFSRRREASLERHEYNKDDWEFDGVSL